jgi:hypothetical protein
VYLDCRARSSRRGVRRPAYRLEFRSWADRLMKQLYWRRPRLLKRRSVAGKDRGSSERFSVTPASSSVDAILCIKSSRYGTASGSDRMLTLNCGLEAQRIARVTVASGRCRLRSRNTHLFRQAFATFGPIGKLHHCPFADLLSLARRFRYSGAASFRVNLFSPVGGELCRSRP